MHSFGAMHQGAGGVGHFGNLYGSMVELPSADGEARGMHKLTVKELLPVVGEGVCCSCSATLRIWQWCVRSMGSQRTAHAQCHAVVYISCSS